MSQPQINIAHSLIQSSSLTTVTSDSILRRLPIRTAHLAGLYRVMIRLLGSVLPPSEVASCHCDGVDGQVTTSPTVIRSRSGQVDEMR